MAEQFIIKAEPTEDNDGVLTSLGMRVVSEYARDHVAGKRNMKLEREYPELGGSFYDIRIDAALARRYAEPDGVEKSMRLDEELEKAFSRPMFILDETTSFVKAMGHKYLRRFKGPKGRWIYIYADDKKKPKGARAPKYAEAERARAADRKAAPEVLRYEGLTETEAKPWHKPGTPVKRHWVDRIPGQPMGIAAPGGDDGGTFAKYGGNMATGRVRDPKRAALHDEIVAGEFAGKKPVPPGEQKLAVVMMGGPASGKSTATQHMGLEEFVHVDPDAIKDHLPEMNMGLNLGKTKDGLVISAKSTAAAVHEESSQLASRVRKKAIADGHHVLVDGTGKNGDKHEKLIKHLQEQGYKVHLVMAHQTPSIAHELNKGRSTTGGRFVPKGVVDGAYAKIPHNFERLAKVADNATMYDATRGHPPKKVWDVQKGPPPKDEHHDADFVSGFKAQFGPGKRGFRKSMKTPAFVIKQ